MAETAPWEDFAGGSSAAVAAPAAAAPWDEFKSAPGLQEQIAASEQQKIERDPESYKKAAIGIGELLDSGKQMLEAVLPPGFIEHATSPVLPSNHLEIKEDDPVAKKIYFGVENKLRDLVSSASSPAMVATLAGGAIPALSKPIATAFLADTLTQIPAAAQAVREADKTPAGSNARVDAALNMATLVAFGGLLGKHLAEKPVVGGQQSEVRGTTNSDGLEPIAPDAAPWEEFKPGQETMVSETARVQPAVPPESIARPPDILRPAEVPPPVSTEAPLLPEVPLRSEEPASPPAVPAQESQPSSPADVTVPSLESQLPSESSASSAVNLSPRADPGGFTESPLVRFIIDDMGGILSKSTARQKWGAPKFEENKSLWEDAPAFRSPRHNQVYRATGETPDAVATAAAEKGLLPEGSTPRELWTALQQESDASHSRAGQVVAQRMNERAAIKQQRSFIRAIEQPIPGEKPITGADLNVGDIVQIGTETMKVTGLDPDTYDVTLEDGSKFGIQHVQNDQAIYGEIAPRPKPESADVFLDEEPTAAIPQLRPGERGTAELFQGEDQPFNLAGEQGIDYAARQAAAEAKVREAADAAAIAERNQRDLFAPEVARQKAMNAAAQAEGASLQAMGLTPAGMSPFIVEDVIPKIKTVGHAIANSYRTLRNAFSPTSAGEGAHTVAGNIREHAAELARKKEMALDQLKDAAKLFRRTSHTFNLDVINRLEKGLPTGSAGLDNYKAARKAMFDQKIAEVRGVNPDALQNLIVDYFPHIWTPESVERLRGNTATLDPANPWSVMFGKRPLEGARSFLKQRSIPTTLDGVALGLEPVTWNPVELDILKMHEMDRYVMGQKIVQEMKDSGQTKFVPAGGRGPQGYTQINDRVARVFAPKNWKIVDDLGNERPGQKLLGHYYAPDDVARVINNYLSPGLKGNALYDSFRFVGNLLNQVQLGVSLYHATFTAIDAATSTMALGIEQIARSGGNLRDIGHGTYNIGRSIVQTPVGAFIENIWRGNKFLREYSRPGTTNAELARIVDAAVAGGARTKMDSFYKSGASHSFFDAIRKGNYAGAAFRLPFAVVDWAAKPLMEVAVPRMKAGIISLQLEYELGRLPKTASRADIRTIAARVVDSVDNRMGQMVYDNLFWNKVLKDSLMASVRSVGWNVGDIRELGGGALDTITAPVRMVRALKGPRGLADNPVVTKRMAYTFALPLMVGTLGAMYQYMATGQHPRDMMDLFMPRTGRLKSDGSEERVMLPTYMKDIAPLALATARHGVRGLVSRGVEMGSNKLHPLFDMIGKMWQNKDYYGVQIANPDDPLTTWAKQEAAYVLKQFVPFSVRGFQQREGPIGAKIQGVAGIMPTPRELTQSAAEELAAKLYVAQLPQGARSQKAADKSQVQRDIVDLKNQKDPAFYDRLHAALRSGAIQPQNVAQILARSRVTPLMFHLQRLTAEQSMQVWDLAAPQERVQMRPVIISKIANSKTLTPQQRITFLRSVK